MFTISVNLKILRLQLSPGVLDLGSLLTEIKGGNYGSNRFNCIGNIKKRISKCL